MLQPILFILIALIFHKTKQKLTCKSGMVLFIQNNKDLTYHVEISH